MEKENSTRSIGIICDSQSQTQYALQPCPVKNYQQDENQMPVVFHSKHYKAMSPHPRLDSLIPNEQNLSCGSPLPRRMQYLRKMPQTSLKLLPLPIKSGRRAANNSEQGIQGKQLDIRSPKRKQHPVNSVQSQKSPSSSQFHEHRKKKVAIIPNIKNSNTRYFKISENKTVLVTSQLKRLIKQIKQQNNITVILKDKYKKFTGKNYYYQTLFALHQDGIEQITCASKFENINAIGISHRRTLTFSQFDAVVDLEEKSIKKAKQGFWLFEYLNGLPKLLPNAATIDSSYSHFSTPQALPSWSIKGKFSPSRQYQSNSKKYTCLKLLSRQQSPISDHETSLERQKSLSPQIFRRRTKIQFQTIGQRYLSSKQLKRMKIAMNPEKGKAEPISPKPADNSRVLPWALNSLRAKEIQNSILSRIQHLDIFWANHSLQKCEFYDMLDDFIWLVLKQYTKAQIIYHKDIANHYKISASIVQTFSESKNIGWEEFVHLYTLAISQRPSAQVASKFIKQVVKGQNLEDLVSQMRPNNIAARFLSEIAHEIRKEGQLSKAASSKMDSLSLIDLRYIAAELFTCE